MAVFTFFFFSSFSHTLLFEYLQLLFYTQILISYKTLYSILLGHFTLHFYATFPSRSISSNHNLPDGVLFCSVAKLCLTLCDPMDCSLQASSVHEISQARILEWVVTVFTFY